MWLSKITIILGIIAFSVYADEKTIDDCLKKDSISCLQMQLYRKAKDIFSQDSISLIGGLSMKKEGSVEGARGTSGVQGTEVEQAKDVETRTRALGAYVWEGARSMFAERKLSWDPVQMGRSIADAVPQELANYVSDLATDEGRGKKKKIKELLPYLLGFKIKITALIIIAYLGIALLAKKAILASLVSLAVSGYIAIKKLLYSKHGHHHEEVTGYHHSAAAAAPAWNPASGAWSNSASGSGWNSFDSGHGEYAAHSSPVAQHIAYNGQKHK